MGLTYNLQEISYPPCKRENTNRSFREENALTLPSDTARTPFGARFDFQQHLYSSFPPPPQAESILPSRCAPKLTYSSHWIMAREIWLPGRQWASRRQAQSRCWINDCIIQDTQEHFEISLSLYFTSSANLKGNCSVSSAIFQVVKPIFSNLS